MFKNLRRPVWAEIDLDRVRLNLEAIRNVIGETEIIGIVKANGYGHGALEISETLVQAGVKSLGVATLDEAIELREGGIDCEIVMLGLTPFVYHEEILNYRLTPVVASYMNTRDLSTLAVQAKKTVPVYIALETGMGRIGFLPGKDSITEITGISKLPNIKIKGLFSHFATAEEKDQTFAYEQLSLFNDFAESLKKVGINTEEKTMANSAAIMTLPESLFTSVRPGILLYGIYPSPDIDKSRVKVLPALNLKANIVFIKKLPKGHPVSYNRKFFTERESIIATLPLGYADGYPRLLSNVGRVLVRGQFAPIVGNICMDQMMIDVTDIPNVRKYDEVVLVGKQGDNYIPLEELADKTDSVHYEILTRLSRRIPRVYFP